MTISIHHMFVRLTLIFLLFLPTPVFADGAEDLPSLIQEALQNNPEIRAAKARWEMAQQRPSLVGVLDDPRLTLAVNNLPVDSFRDDRSPMTGKVVKLSQALPFPGKLGLKSSIATLQADWEGRQFEEAELRLVAQVRQQVAELHFRQRSITLLEKSLRLVDDLNRLVETRYAVGQGGQQDVLRAQLERSRLSEKLFVENQQRDTARAMLNTLLGRAADAPLNVDSSESVVAQDLPPRAELQAYAVAHRPLLKGYEALLDQYREKLKLAKKDYWPDISLGVAYTQREAAMTDPGTDFFSAEVGIVIPWQQKRRDAASEEAAVGIRMVREESENSRNRILRDLEQSLLRIEQLETTQLLYRSALIPQGEQAYQAGIQAYQVGAIGYASLIDALLALNRDEIALARSERDLAQEKAQLFATLGLRATESLNHVAAKEIIP